jgi:hypothetical protein
MNTNKAAYWIAVGVLALGLNSEYRHGNFAALHRVAERADSAFCWVAACRANAGGCETPDQPRRFAADDLVASAGANPKRPRPIMRPSFFEQIVPDRVRHRNVRENERQTRPSRGNSSASRNAREIEQIRLHARSQFKFPSECGGLSKNGTRIS